MTGNQTAGQQAASRFSFPAVVTAVVVVLALGVIVVSHVSGWRVNFANTAWGAIVAALITGIVGVFLKGRVDAELARSQGEITERIQTKLEDGCLGAKEQRTGLRARRGSEPTSKVLICCSRPVHSV